MKVILDGSQVYHRYEHGFKYFHEMLPRLVKIGGFDLELIPSPVGLISLPGAVTARDPFGAARGWIPRGRLRAFLSSKKHRLEKIIWTLRTPRATPALFHSISYTLPPTEKLPLLTTALDLIPEKFGGTFAYQPPVDVLARRARCIESARHIIAISECTRQDVLERFRLPEARVSVVHMGVDLEYFANRTALTTPRAAPYFLQVGGRAHHKNFFRLLEAYAASQSRKDIHLVAVGEAFDDDEKAAIERLRLHDRVHNIIKAEESELRTLLQNAVALLYPSLYEGFGMPPVEAMAAGTPVAAGRAGSLPEITGDAALLFDPADTDAIRDAIERIADPQTGAECRARGLVNARRFSWDKTAERTAAVYRNFFGAHA